MVICPYCEDPAKLVKGSHVYPHRRDLAGKDFWRCDPCDAHVGCHPGSVDPLGALANAEIRRARQHCHRAFDPLWQDAWRLPVYQIDAHVDPRERRRAIKSIRRAARTRSYRWLANQLGIDPEDCHIGHMTDLEQLRAIYRLCKDASAYTIRAWWKSEAAAKHRKDAA